MPRSRRGAHKRNDRKWVCLNCGDYVKYDHQGTVMIDNTGKRWCRQAGKVCGQVVNRSQGGGS